jgi:hypothetical protein
METLTLDNAYKKPLNAVKYPEHAELVRRIIRCPLPVRAGGPDCGRAIIEYTDMHLPETRHTPGSLPDAVVEKAIAHGARVVELACNYHGGIEYERPRLNV